MSLIEATAKDRLNIFKLEAAEQFPSWQRQLQDYLFKRIRNVNMDQLDDATTLDGKYFKAHGDFKAEYNELKRNDEPLDDEDFCSKCKAHAVKTGQGFQDWVYCVFADVRSALSMEIQEKTASVDLGDLKGLLEAIKLSIHKSETLNKHDLDIEYARCTMSNEGRNDLMTFLSALARYLRRLEAAGIIIDDAKKQRVLIHGLDQDIFERFCEDATRRPYNDYNSLIKAVQKYAAKPHVLKQLRALKPGHAQAALTTRASPEPTEDTHHRPESQRLDRIEAILVSMQAAQPKQQPKSQNRICFKFQKGACPRGDKCPYEHTLAGGRSANKHNKFCALHKSPTHDTSECRMVKNNPALAELLSSRNGHRINKTTSAPVETNGPSPDSDYSFMFPTRASLPQYVFAMRGAPKIDMWCVDGAATTSATYDRSRCFNIRPCKVIIHGERERERERERE